MAAEPVTVRILDRDYRLACGPDEREALISAAARVDGEMRAIREQARVAGAERIAVLAALNIASELGAMRTPAPLSPAGARGIEPPDQATTDTAADPGIMRRMQSIHALLDTAFVEQERLF